MNAQENDLEDGVGFVGRGTRERGATFSLCGQYRYKLWRRWSDAERTMVFVGLNPSTADETTDDQTIRKCVRFAQREQCGKLLMMNLYAFRASDPKDMLAAADPVGPMNMELLKANFLFHSFIVAAWGCQCRKQADVVKRLLLECKSATALALAPVKCFGVTKEGHPKHPLYLPFRTPLVEFPLGGLS